MAKKFECTRCRLAETRQNIVVGKGVMYPDFLFMGEAPGKDEDREGLPFVGDSGKLLDKLLLMVQQKIGRTYRFFFINTVMCRPTDAMLGPNRVPTEDEIFACRGNVMHLIRVVKPVNIVLVGETAVKYYSSVFDGFLKILHPAYILRRGGVASSEFFDCLNLLEDFFTCNTR